MIPVRTLLWTLLALGAVGTTAALLPRAVADSEPAQRDTKVTTPEERCARCRSLSRVVNCGHRGSGPSRATSPFPENTLPAFHHATRSGASMIELDVTLTADDQLIVFHDERLDRTTTGTGCVSRSSLAYIRSLNAAKGTAAPQQHVGVPTLAEVMSTVDADLNIEIKVHPGFRCPPIHRSHLAHRVIEEIRGDTKRRRTIISSFDVEVLQIVEAIGSDPQTGLISDSPRALRIVRRTAIDALHLHTMRVSRRVVAAARAAGIPLRVWTENDPQAMVALARIGVDTLITDHPERLTELLAAACSDSQLGSASCSP